jgi:hypothetical protein
MNQPKYVIVVGVDYSAASERALNEAYAIACTMHVVHLHVVNVHPALDEPVAVKGEAVRRPPLEHWAAELREYVARQAAAFQANAGLGRTAARY